MFEKTTNGWKSGIGTPDLTNGTGRLVQPVAVITGRRKTSNPKCFIGSGKLEELTELIAEQGIEVVLVNHVLSLAKKKILKNVLNIRVIDRNGLIFDIFTRRAQTHEGKLQIELAQLGNWKFLIESTY